MGAYLQIWGDAGGEVVPLEGDRIVVGRDPTNDVVLASDPTVSRVHAVLERYPSGWTIRDLGAANGTFVNGELLAAERALRPGDEVRVGATQLVFRVQTGGERELPDRTIAISDEPPELTRRERDVLVELCRPLVVPGQFAHPATVAEIARVLVVSRAAVTFHLDNLYEKFGIAGQGTSRRVDLANAALASGAVRRAELRKDGGGGAG